MEVLIIERKKRPCYVLKLKVKDLDKTKCSFKFLSHNFDNDMDVYVKCDAIGNIEHRGNKQEYGLLDVNKHTLL